MRLAIAVEAVIDTLGAEASDLGDFEDRPAPSDQEHGLQAAKDAGQGGSVHRPYQPPTISSGETKLSEGSCLAHTPSLTWSEDSCRNFCKPT